jgi:pimeloyl-ACP methyl ester carboxylesterase
MPERLSGVLLICPVIIADPAKRELPGRTVFFRDEELLAGIGLDDRKFFERMVSQQDKKRWERFQQDILPGRKIKDEAFLNELKHHGYGFSFDVDSIGHPFDKPSLVFAGRQDASVGFKDTLRIIDNYTRGTFAMLDRASHSLEVEQEEVFNTLVVEWLDRVNRNKK